MNTTASAVRGVQGQTAYAGIVLPTRDEIAETIAPYVVERHPVDSSAWKAIAGPVQRYFWKKYHIKRLLKRNPRSQSKVRNEYEETWDFRDWPSPTDLRMKLTPCTWGDQGLHVRTNGTKRVHLLLLARVLRALKPKTVLEVGAGNGLNILVLAAMFPDIQFTSIELTAAGVAKARSAQAEETLPRLLMEYAPEPVLDPTAHRRADIRQGDASRLEFADDTFDLVYTSLALEQMQAVRDAAVSECARVARHHVVNVEPFREVNDRGTRKHYTLFNNYLDLKIAELPRFGLEPKLTFDDIPHKVTIGYGLAVSKVQGA